MNGGGGRRLLWTEEEEPEECDGEDAGEDGRDEAAALCLWLHCRPGAVPREKRGNNFKYVKRLVIGRRARELMGYSRPLSMRWKQLSCGASRRDSLSC